MTLTPYGQAIRKIRIDKQITMRDMCDQVGSTPSYWSSVENGKRKVPLLRLTDVFKALNMSMRECLWVEKLAKNQNDQAKKRIEGI